MLDQISHLFRLQAVIEAGSMRKAAAAIGVTQPALTRSIAQLEARFGKPLLVRSSQGVVPTAFGSRVVASVNRLSRQWELAEADLTEAGTAATGILRVSAGPLWRSVVLPEVVTRLQRDFPGLDLVIESGSYRSALPDLLEGRIDAVFGGVTIAHAALPRITRREFITITDRVVARADHPLMSDVENGELRDPMRVFDFPWIVYVADPIYELETIHGTTERLGRAPDIRIRSESLIATLAFIQKGDYLGVLPENAVAAVSNPRIVPVPINLGHRKIFSGVVYREEMEDWPPMAHLLKLCEAYFAGH